jgi:hypothetical protein
VVVYFGATYWRAVPGKVIFRLLAGTRKDLMEPDSKRIVRQWNREIEAEMRRDGRQEEGPWKIVVWVALEVLWFVALFAVLFFFERLQR